MSPAPSDEKPASHVPGGAAPDCCRRPRRVNRSPAHTPSQPGFVPAESLFRNPALHRIWPRDQIVCCGTSRNSINGRHPHSELAEFCRGVGQVASLTLCRQAGPETRHINARGKQRFMRVLSEAGYHRGGTAPSDIGRRHGVVSPNVAGVAQPTPGAVAAHTQRAGQQWTA